jgi:hypothetical protein
MATVGMHVLCREALDGCRHRGAGATIGTVDITEQTSWFQAGSWLLPCHLIPIATHDWLVQLRKAAPCTPDTRMTGRALSLGRGVGCQLQHCMAQRAQPQRACPGACLHACHLDPNACRCRRPCALWCSQYGFSVYGLLGVLVPLLGVSLVGVSLVATCTLLPSSAALDAADWEYTFCSIHGVP